MSKKIFNYTNPGSNGHWNDMTSFFTTEQIDEISGSLKPRKNPRVAVPSPYARFQIVKEAFDSVRGIKRGKRVDDRDQMLVSQVIDLLEFIFDGGLTHFNLSVDPINIDAISDNLIENGDEDKKIGVRLLGSTLKAYAHNEKFGLEENPTLYIIHELGEPLAITSPTSIIMPTPNYLDWVKVIKLEGERGIFTKEINLVDRKPEFITYLYSWYEQLIKKNGGEPEPLKNFGRYLSDQADSAPRHIRQLIDEAKKMPLGNNYDTVLFNNVIPEIWGVPFYTLKATKVSDIISQQSDLRLKPTNPKAPYQPLILTTNNIYADMAYTSAKILWNSKDPGFSYSDLDYKEKSIGERRTLPNGIKYEEGFVYEHDFLADTLFQLPYRLNSEIFFDGNVEGIDELNIGFIPPVKEIYFDYFNVSDLHKNLKIVAKRNTVDSSLVDVVEVYLSLPTTKGRQITLKKTYYSTESFSEGLRDVSSSSKHATGVIAVNCAIAVNALPFNRPFLERNYYAFMLYSDHNKESGLGSYIADLKLCRFADSEKENTEIKENYYRYVRRTENNLPIISSYILDGGNFDYLKIEFSEDSEKATSDALLIPKKGIPSYVGIPGNNLEFCFDFGTSNTYIAVKDTKGNFIDFKLPSLGAGMVSTIGIDTSDSADLFLNSCNEYCRQEFIPIFSVSKNPFPVASVLVTPKVPDDSIDDELKTKPFLSASISFIYGVEDFGRQYNQIKDDLKWQNRKKNGEKTDPHFTKNFINELLLLAQIFAMSENADLEKCRITWTYPLSMNKREVDQMQSYWVSGYSQFFKGKYEDIDELEGANVSSFPESMSPMLYLLGNSKIITDTGISVDIGGGTCDIVIVPDEEIPELKLTSVGFGAESILGLKKEAQKITMFSQAVKGINKILLSKASKNTPNADDYKKAAEDLQYMLDEGKSAREMATYLFNLPNNPKLSSIGKQLSFNKWLQDHDFHHSVFIYYYGALIYYIADLWKAFDAEKPSTIFFSGSGSKMLGIISRGEKTNLEYYTTSLFNIFAAEALDRLSLEDDIEIKIENKEPKQITAKGVLVESNDESLKELKDRLMQNGKVSKYAKYHTMMENDRDDLDLTYNDLRDEEIQAAVFKSVLDFHEKLRKFLYANKDEFGEIVMDMENKFLGKSERDISKKVRSLLKKASKECKEGDLKYPDVPFFEVIKYFIEVALVPDTI